MFGGAGHNKIPKLLLASRISLNVKRVRKEAQRDGWVEVGMGIVCVVVTGELVARVL